MQFILDNKRLQHLMISAYNNHYRQLSSSIDFMKTLLKQTLDCLSKPFIVIDGLDEMDDRERAVLLQTMLEVLNQNKELSILFSSRPEDDIARLLLAQQTLSIRVHDANHLDIEAYVDGRASSFISELSELSELSTSSAQPQMIRKLMQKVAINSQGMFLYARLLCDTVVRNGDVAGLKEAVENLPDGLNEAYDRILETIESLSERERHESRQILSLVASSAVPLTRNEIQLAVLTTRIGDASQGIEGLFLNIMRRCGPIVEELSGYIQFVHFTAYEYLLGSQSKNYLKDPETHALISSMSMKYLGSSCFDPDLSDDALKQHVLSGAYVLENYVCIHWLDHLRSAESGCSDSQIQLANSLASTRWNPMYSGDQASAETQSYFAFIGDCCLDFANAYAFSKKRKRDLCFTDEPGPFYLLDDPAANSQHARVYTLRYSTPSEQLCLLGAEKFLRRRYIQMRQAWLSLLQNRVRDESQKLAKTGSQRRKISKRQELKLILIDAVKEDDLETLQDMWDEAKAFRSKLLLTAIQEQSSHEMLAYLIEQSPYGKMPISNPIACINCRGIAMLTL
ncbi:hypothetical protein Neosp_007979 [[Neocosmospora] mangrovei]